MSEASYLDPNNDGATIQWTRSAGTKNYTCIDDAIRQPDMWPGTLDYVSTITLGYVDVYTFPDTIQGVDSVSNVTVWVCGNNDGGESPTVDLSVYMGGGWAANQTASLVNDAAWYSKSFNGTWTQADLDNLQVRFTKSGGAGIASVYIMYVIVTYEFPAAGGVIAIPQHNWAPGFRQGIEGGWA